MYKFLRADTFDDSDSPVALSTLVPAATGSGSRGEVMFVFDSVGTVSGQLVPAAGVVGVELKADSQYESGPYAWPGSFPRLVLASGAEVRVSTFVSAIAP
jgi:hypothetical protein